MFFNLSGTRDQYALAISQLVDVGVDIESHKPRKNLTGLAESVLSNSELTRFRQLPCEHQQDYFYRAWSLKEATLKADGRGITLPLQSIGFDTNSTIGAVGWNETLGNKNRWDWYYFKLEGISLALATRTTS
ncbi:4'-phosphopantetheinyl transferase family protein [Endozoicomonas lisbonensis]|uniref:4'-phosphopantetheinyl transferase family protein n=1 Tax=Endozoicomonas lisbonensis TaxID=3120522 RepID=UPI0033929456